MRSECWGCVGGSICADPSPSAAAEEANAEAAAADPSAAGNEAHARSVEALPSVSTAVRGKDANRVADRASVSTTGRIALAKDAAASRSAIMCASSRSARTVLLPGAQAALHDVKSRGSGRRQASMASYRCQVCHRGRRQLRWYLTCVRSQGTCKHWEEVQALGGMEEGGFASSLMQSGGWY
jgi:hypothetical protein